MFGMIPFEHQNNMLDLFDQFDRNFFGTAGTPAAFRTDIKDQGDSYLLEAELPGFDKDDIHLDLKDGLLTISATHTSQTEEKDKDGVHYVRRERRTGSFSRSFDVSGIDEDGITAAYQNGVLALTLPKAGKVIPQPRRIEIQ